jgi:TPR repeat protein
LAPIRLSRNPEAFDAYLKGYYFFERNTDKDADMAVKYFERATQLDPGYALAWVGLSQVRNWQDVTAVLTRTPSKPHSIT